MRWAGACGAVLVMGCGAGIGPEVDPIAPVQGAVGSELRIVLHARSPSGSSVKFDYRVPEDLDDLKRRMLKPTLTSYAAGFAVFSWIPLASDVGEHFLRFVAASQGEETVVEVGVTVAPGTGALPIFREPIGDGTTLELQQSACADISVEVQDSDHPQVALSFAPADFPNAQLMGVGDSRATFHFCPSSEQTANRLIYPFTFSADNGERKPVLKNYTIVVRPSSQSSCQSQAPTLTTKAHTNITTTNNLHFTAQIDDDIGVTSARMWWTKNPPINPAAPDLSTFSLIDMARKKGTPLSGDYEAILASPVAALPSGSAMKIYYLLEAADADPPLGCDHRSLMPPSGTFSFTVTKP